MLPHLRDKFTVVTYDLRGHGESPLPETEFGLDDLVDDLERLRDRLRLKRMHLAGHSLGGMIGPRYALRFPDRVSSLGLYSTAAGRTEDDSAKVRAVVEAMEQKGIEKVLGRLFDVPRLRQKREGEVVLQDSLPLRQKPAPHLSVEERSSPASSLGGVFSPIRQVPEEKSRQA